MGRTRITMAFDPQGLTLPLNRILPTRALSRVQKSSAVYRRTAASVRELGLIHPLIVYPVRGKSKDYTLLDGHMRLEILRDMGVPEAQCLVSTSNESYTYNKQVNRIPPIQEHFMILKAIENGCSEEAIARTLQYDVESIRRKRDLLGGICPEAVALLKDKPISAAAIGRLKKVLPVRQVEIAELMASTRNHTISYAKALVAATPPDQRVEEGRLRESEGIAPKDLERMQREMDSLSREFKAIDEAHAQNVFNLVLARGYVEKLLNNGRVARFLGRHHPDLVAELEKILKTTSLDAA